MLDDVLQLEVSPPAPLDTFFDPSFLHSLANPAKKETIRSSQQGGSRKKGRETTLEGVMASAKQAALASLREQAQPEHIVPEAKAPEAVEKKQRLLRRSHHKAVARPVYAAPSPRSRKITVEPKPEPASLKPRKAKAMYSIQEAMRRLDEMYDALHMEIVAAKLQVTEGTCNTLPAAEARASEALNRVRKVHAFAAKKRR